jgi:hypothetical protein
MNPIHQRIHAVVRMGISDNANGRTVGPQSSIVCIARATASLQPGLAERLDLRPEVKARCFEKSGSVVSRFGSLLDN